MYIFFYPESVDNHRTHTHMCARVGLIRNHTLFVIIRGFVDGEYGSGGVRGFRILSVISRRKIRIYTGGVLERVMEKIVRLDLPLIIHTTTTFIRVELFEHRIIPYRRKEVL